MRGFEKVPDLLATEVGLSLQARAVYPVLLYLAWRNGARAGERVELPPLEGIAEACGCGTTALKGYLSELRRAGWIETRRAARGRPQVYVVHAQPRETESASQKPPRGTDSVPRVGRNASHSRARVPPSSDTPPDGDYVPSGEDDPLEPPPIVMVAGRNLPLDALAEVCGVDPASPRYGRAVAALNGRGAEPGIRHLFWEEATRWAEQNGQVDRLEGLRSDPEQFARALEQAVRRKAEKYRAAMRGATMTPTALRDWWLDLELARRSDQALTPDEIARIQ